MKIKYIILLSVCMPILSFGDYAINYQPVNEIYVDELPAGILDEIHASSKLPVVFRGGAKKWEAMNWTPEILEKRGLDYITGIESKTKNLYIPYFINFGLGIDFENQQRKSFLTVSLISRAQGREIMGNVLQDTHFLEYTYQERPDTIARFLAENWPEQSLDDHYKHVGGTYSYEIFAGAKNYKGKFHGHASVLLVEFYGEKLVFLVQPGTEAIYSASLIRERNRIIEECKHHTMDLLSLYSPNDYAPFQVVILKPGDILHIPSGWIHSVYYLSACIGVSQFIQTDYKNIYSKEEWEE